jgi:tetratricopeptide (TPR) repeat protein
VSSSAGGRTRVLLRAALVLAVLLAAVGARVVSSARSELRAGDAYAKRGEVEAALVRYRRAARWYAPLSPYHVQALARLGAIGADAERRERPELALEAYRAIRAAILSTRSWYVPEQVRLRAADERIASLMAALPAPPMDAGKSRERLRREHLALLRADPDPSVAWTLVLLFGFGSWVAGAFAFTLRAIDADDRFIPRQVWRWGAVIVVGFGMFVLGMSLA